VELIEDMPLVVRIKSDAKKVKVKDKVFYYPCYRITIPRKFIEKYELKEGDLLYILPLIKRNIEAVNKGFIESIDLNKIEDLTAQEVSKQLGLTRAEAQIYITLLKLGRPARCDEIAKMLGKNERYILRLLTRMVKEEVVLKIKKKRTEYVEKRGRPFFLYEAVRPDIFKSKLSHMLEESLIKKALDDFQKIKEQTGTINETQNGNPQESNVMKIMVARRIRREMREYAKVEAIFPKVYVGRKFIVALIE
jgi:predicted transcriptional regulator